MSYRNHRKKEGLFNFIASVFWIVIISFGVKSCYENAKKTQHNYHVKCLKDNKIIFDKKVDRAYVDSYSQTNITEGKRTYTINEECIVYSEVVEFEKESCMDKENEKCKYELKKSSTVHTGDENKRNEIKRLAKEEEKRQEERDNDDDDFFMFMMMGM